MEVVVAVRQLEAFLLPVRRHVLGGFSFFVAVALASALRTAADIGQHHGQGFSGPFLMTIPGGSWGLEQGACFVGRARNLVVTPLPRPPYPSPQPLDVTTVGTALCRWLDSKYAAHQALKTAWEKRHQEEKDRTGWWNLWRRFSNWRSSFPKFEIRVSVSYLDLWHNDFYGHPLPWFSGEIHYIPPSDRHAYNLFDHLASAFTMFTGTLPQEVFFLLAPAPTFNMPIETTQSDVTQVAAVAIHKAAASKMLQRQHIPTIMPAFPAWAVPFMFGDKAFTFHVKRADFWVRGFDCMLGSRLVVRWSRVDVSVCDYMAAKSNAKKAAADLAAAVISTVRLRVVGMDFFQYAAPLFSADMFDEITNQVSLIPIRMYLTTDPQLTHEYETARSISTAIQVGQAGAALVQNFVHRAREAKPQGEHPHGTAPGMRGSTNAGPR
uniref:Dense granule protein GRA12 n=1 Tax=Neospora caninum (strain Liverpool) TaxID=572307 RepID=A0A0F7UEK3_NEOCL|nr:TPA: dense granule protein GRA12 [Neospora caninum Liverpool]